MATSPVKSAKLISIRLSETERCSAIWLEAWNQISLSSTLSYTVDCLAITLGYAENVQERDRQLEVLQKALHYANLIYTEQHEVSAGIQIRIAKICMEMQQYSQAETLLSHLSRQLNSAS